GSSARARRWRKSCGRSSAPPRTSAGNNELRGSNPTRRGPPSGPHMKQEQAHMTHEISSLMDGELHAHEAEQAIRSCCTSREVARKWQEYHLIGDVLRGGMPHPTRTAERVMDAIAAEPAIIARPRRVLDTTAGRIALAAAASVATIGVVGWIGTQGGQVP